MAKQQKRPVSLSRISNPRFGYSGQWTHSASPTSKNAYPAPYVVSLAKDGNWSCSCMNWTRTHPREDCKHIMRVKLSVNTPAPAVTMASTPSLALPTYTGRKMRD